MVPVYAVAWVVGLVFAYVGTKYDRRAYTIVAVHSIAVLGFAILLGTPSSAHNTRYAAIFLCAMGLFTCKSLRSRLCRLIWLETDAADAATALAGAIWLSWAVATAGLDQMKAIAAATVVGLGTMGSIVASWSYLPFDAPRYNIGNSLNLAATILGQLLAVGLMIKNKRENALRERGGRGECRRMTSKVS